LITPYLLVLGQHAAPRELASVSVTVANETSVTPWLASLGCTRS